MGINTIKVTAIMIVAVTLITGCRGCKNTICADATSYSFNLPIQIIPDKDSIHINDTIWLQVNVPTVFKDTLSGQNIDYNGAKILD